MDQDPERINSMIEKIVCDAQMLRWNNRTRSEYSHERPIPLDRALSNTFGSRLGLNTLAETCIREGFEYAIMNGENIEIGLEYLKDKARIPQSTIVWVAMNNTVTLDFAHLNTAAVDRLETCIAVSTRKGMTGTLSHLSITYPIEAFFDLISDEPVDSRVHIVGGHMDTESEEYLSKLEEGLNEMGFRIAGKDVLGPIGTYRRFKMHTSGLVEVEHYKELNYPDRSEEITDDTKFML